MEQQQKRRHERKIKLTIQMFSGGKEDVQLSLCNAEFYAHPLSVFLKPILHSYCTSLSVAVVNNHVSHMCRLRLQVGTKKQNKRM